LQRGGFVHGVLRDPELSLIGTSSEYVRELIRIDQDRQQLRELLLAGAESMPGETVTAAYFDGLRVHVLGNETKPRDGA